MTPPDPLPIGDGAAISLEEIELRASRSSGPGGQHANVTSSRIEAVFDVASAPSLTEAQRRRLQEKLGDRVTAVSQDARSQARNRELAIERLQSKLREGLSRPKKRRPTKPSRGAKERRMEQKRRTSQRKAERRQPPPE
ncbi:MAG TPA: alternative ribosome rescue aminoacyl-tRNA hydrolase ArfB [Solirubrobacterales bacterium]|jgi:ribosome-associated protein|nr:alternative ribosome rescue aminoacyl-tRNA hydrolase ArfB [Solirubrobacterales bacterium]